MKVRRDAFKFAVDANYLVCVLQSWNTHHEATLSDLTKRLQEGQLLHIIPHTLLETYSVMTRMPDPFRKSPTVVHELLRKNFEEFPTTATPAPAAVWSLLADLGSRGLGGGQSHDRWIASTVHATGMHALVTWDVKRYQPNSWAGLEIISPARPAL